MSKRIRHITAIIAMAMVAVLPLRADEAPQHEVAEAVAPVATVRPGTHCIVVELNADGPRVAAVFALTGQMVRQTELEPGINRIEMPAGYYIVRIDSQSQRVVVR